MSSLELGTAELPLSRWERAYQSFETPEQELRKFLSRLRSVGVGGWSRQSRVLEVCCGRGSGVRAWKALGFARVVGLDRSSTLISVQTIPGSRLIGDARELPLQTDTFDIAIVQGGLHHLESSQDVDKALGEIRRVVVPGGRVVIIEPWLTPSLRIVHWICEQPLARRLSPKVDALACMIQEERETYERWLHSPDELLGVIGRHVSPHVMRRRWGKLIVVGSPA